MRGPRSRRRLALAGVLAVAGSSCATPRIALAPRFVDGEVRTYRLTARADIAVRAAGLDRTEQTSLEAISRLEVLGLEESKVRVRVSLSPSRFVRDGVRADPPAPQEADVELSPGGGVLSVTRIGGVPAPIAGTEVDDVIPLLGLRMPAGRVRLGDRWRFPVRGPADRAGEVRGRLAAVRVVDGRDAAIVSASVRRPIVRERALLAGAALTLAGDEISAVEIALAFREGFPLRVDSAGVARLEIGGAAQLGGTVELRTQAGLRLLRRTVP